MVKTKTLNAISPSISLVLVMAYSIFMSVQEHLYISMLLPIVFSAFWVKKAWWSILKRLLWLNSFIALIALTLFFQNNAMLALLILIRSNFILLFVLFLFHDKDEFSIATAMHQLRLPHKFTSIFFFTAKFIFLTKHEFIHFKKTLYVRGFTPKTNLLSYQTIAGFVGILIIKALKRSDELQKVLRLRAFKNEVYSLSAHPKLSFADGIVIVLTLLAFVLKEGVIL